LARTLLAFALGFVYVMLVAGPWLTPARGGHVDTGCVGAPTNAWVEAVRENNTRVEDGVHGQIQITFPDGGPVQFGGLVESLWAFRNADNKAEVGWKWIRQSESQQKTFAFRRDQGQAHLVVVSGSAGERGSWHHYRVHRTGGNHWLWKAEDDQIHEHTFNDLNDNLLMWANSEVKNTCDNAWSYQRDLTEKDLPGGDWTDWDTIENFDPGSINAGTENPCWHTDLIANNEFKVVHGQGAGNEECE
jgi:hypothetical protein